MDAKIQVYRPLFRNGFNNRAQYCFLSGGSNFYLIFKKKFYP